MGTRVLCLAAVAVLSLGMVSAAWSQLPPPAPNAPQSAPGAAETTVKTVENLDLAEPTPNPVTARLGNRITARIGKGGDSVRLVGTARGVKSGAGSQSTIGQVVWNGVQADVNGRKRQAPLDKPLLSSFVLRATSVPSGTEVKATGDLDGVVAAARRLFDVPVEEARKAENDKKEPKQRTAPVGGGGSSNDMAAQYQPLPPPPAKAEAPELPTATGITTEGCTPRIDEAQGVVIVQSRVATSTGGVVTAEGACSDSEVRYIIQKSYASCSDRVDVAGPKAYAQLRKYWTDDQGRTSFLGDCVDDADNTFELTEDMATCTYDVDLAAMQAFKRAELVYIDRQNQRVLVEACRRTAAAGLPVTRTADGCTFRHDFQAHVSYQQKKLVYTNAGGSVVPVAECSDDTTDTYAHNDVRNVCADLVDQPAGKAFPQRRWQILPPAGPLWISECEPIADESTDLVATVDGCETVFYHNLSAGQSFGANRYYYSWDGGLARTYVNSCQQSTVAYQHKSEIQGYEYRDPEKFGLPKTAIYLTAPIGRVDVSAAQVREGAPQIPYTFARTTTVPKAEQKYWEGCNAYTPTEVTDYYKRPDATEAGYVKGPGAPTGPVDECTRVTEAQTVYVYTTGSGAPQRFTLFVNTYNSARSWPLPGPGNAVIGTQYNTCSGGASMSPQSALFQHMSQNQSRVRTTYPNGGGTTYSAWTATSAAYPTASFSCTEYQDSPA